jgi:DNA modification methylase
MSEGKKEILLGDCLELMKDIPSGSIDMILCDLPYGTTACKWDTIIPFEPLWEQYERIIKDNGAIVLTASQPFTTFLIHSNIELFRYEWIYEKTKSSNFMMAKKQPMKNHENVVVFYKKQPVYNPQMTKAEKLDIRKKNGVYKQRDDSVLGGEAKSFRKKETGWRYPKSVQLFNNSDKTKNIHPTQKPVELFEYLIKTYTNEGDLVLDNCAGSGTTAIACLKTNRQFIVMEKEQKYYDIILKRVADFSKQQTLFKNEV